MEETAKILLDRLESLDRRISKLESIVLPQQQQSPPPLANQKKLQSFAVAGYKNLFFHYKDPGFEHMLNVLNQLVRQLPSKGKTEKQIDVYAHYVTGRPEIDVDGRQFQGYKILLLDVPPGVDIASSNVYNEFHFDAQIKVELDGSYKRLNVERSRAEIEKLINKL